MFNNKIYGLTKGQYSPTSGEGTKSPTTPFGSLDYPINPVSFALGSGATFVARAIDVDAKSLGAILEQAKAHKGTSLIEVIQNCPIFNDGVWDAVTNRKTAGDNQLRLEEGKPLLFQGGAKGIRMGPDLCPEVVEVGEGEGQVPESELLVHSEAGSPAYHAVLASMNAPEFPQPLGVIRKVAKPSYDELATAQVDQVVAERGKGDLDALLKSGMTWSVGPDGRPIV